MITDVLLLSDEDVEYALDTDNIKLSRLQLHDLAGFISEYLTSEGQFYDAIREWYSIHEGELTR